MKKQWLGNLISVVLLVVGLVAWIMSPWFVVAGLAVLLATGVLSWEDVLKHKGAWDTVVWFSALQGYSKGDGGRGRGMGLPVPGRRPRAMSGRPPTQGGCAQRQGQPREVHPRRVQPRQRHQRQDALPDDARDPDIERAVAVVDGRQHQDRGDRRRQQQQQRRPRIRPAPHRGRGGTPRHVPVTLRPLGFLFITVSHYFLLLNTIN